jgi:hypothetical protein
VQNALKSLPCVEPDSIKIDVPAQEARFTVKDKSKCEIGDVTKAIEKVGFTVTDAKLLPAHSSP